VCDLPAVAEHPGQVAGRLGRALGAALPAGERPRLGAALRQVAARAGETAAPLIDPFLSAVLSTEG
jgi:hypothetical protein